MQRYKLNKDALQAQWIKIKEWWIALTLREQQAVAVGGSLFALFILYQFIWSPILTHLDDMRKQIVTSEKTLAWMKSTDVAMSKLAKESHRERAQASTPVILMSAFQKHVQQAGLEAAMSELKQASNDTIEVHFQKVGFDKLIKLLTAFVKEQRVVIAQMSVNPEAASGVVNVDLLLKL
ncbi:MAG: type II secretion system protein GspM, partial [Gammaproteobacteria bacterium]